MAPSANTTHPNALPLRGQERQLLATLKHRNQTMVDLQVDDDWLGSITKQPRKLLWRLKEKQLAHPLQAGRYLIDTDGVPRARPRLRSLAPLGPFLLARLEHDFYLSWHSALWWHGLVDQQSRRLYVAVTERKLSAHFGAWDVQFVTVRPRKFFGGQPAERDGAALLVASTEKAVVDSFDRPELSGGIDVAVVALRRAYARGILNSEQLVADAIAFESPTLNRRLGFFMERYAIPGSGELRLRLGKGYAVPLAPGGPTQDPSIRVDTRWGIAIDPDVLNAADLPK